MICMIWFLDRSIQDLKVIIWIFLTLSKIHSYLIPFPIKFEIMVENQKCASNIDIPHRCAQLFDDLYFHNAMKEMVNFILREKLCNWPNSIVSPAMLSRRITLAKEQNRHHPVATRWKNRWELMRVYIRIAVKNTGGKSKVYVWKSFAR